MVDISDLKIGLIYGGYSSERDISIKSGKAVEKALKELNLNYKVFDPIDREGFIKGLIEYKPDLVFNILHGKGGEDGVIQGVLEFLGFKHTTSSVKTSALTMDKDFTKRILKTYNIPMADWIVIKNEKDLEKLDISNFPKVVKPAEEGSSIGVHIVNSKDELIETVKDLLKLNQKILIEDFIKGREITVGVLYGEPLDIIEIKVKNGFYDYKNKYLSNDTEYICPADIEKDIYKYIQNLSVEIYNILECSGAVRIDYILGEDGRPYFLEINTIPGMTDHSLLPKASQKRGLNFKNLVLEIIKGALNGKK